MAKSPRDAFYARYVGPRGRHLSCLTKMTMTGERATEGNLSIKPRKWGKRGPKASAEG